MLLTYARAFAVLAASLEFNRGQVNGLLIMGNYSAVTAESAIGQATINSLSHLKNLCSDIPSLNPVIPQIERLEANIGNGIMPILLANNLEQFQHRIFDELGSHYYYPVTEAYAATYMNEAPFGESVYSYFPSARLDISNAGKCVILGQGTAGVFHLMRVMEIALRVLGRDLDIEYAPSWEAYIRQITKCIAMPYADKRPKWRRKEAFYKEILGDLTSIKVAWRNPTMHISADHSVDHATTIYQAVMGMLNRMANNGMKEKGRPVNIAQSSSTEL